jgi:ATP-binding cassette subfamily F protein uup
MDKMVDHLFVFNGQADVKDIIGNYSVYRKVKAEETRVEKKQAKEEVKETSDADATPPKEKKKLSYKEQQEFNSLEGDLENLEEEKKQLTVVLSDANSSNEELMSAGERLAQVVQQIEEKTDRWLELSEYQ